MEYIRDFEYKGLWGTKDIVWHDINEDVNILVGINGAGKTTILSLIEKELLRRHQTVLYIPSVDNIALHDRRRTASALSQDLDYYVYDLKNGPSLMMMLMGSFGKPVEQQTAIGDDVQRFLSTINEYLGLSQKRIAIDGSKLVVITSEGKSLSIDLLSSGEKYLILLFLRVYLLNSRPAVVLIDEPENTLHVRWQFNIVDTLTRINPKAQFIIATHSPSLFGRGWGDKVVYMDNIMKDV